MDYSILVNKTNPIPHNYNVELISYDSRYKNNILVEKKTLESFMLFQKDALNNEIEMDIESGYRTHEYQQMLVDNLIKEKGIEYASKYIAMPYHSEHETGLALDICIYINDKCLIEHDITNLEQTVWIQYSAYKYGFILRYPKGKENITGYNYEPWHFRYVGVELAKYLFNNDLTLEEYYTGIVKK